MFKNKTITHLYKAKTPLMVGLCAAFLSACSLPSEQASRAHSTAIDLPPAKAFKTQRAAPFAISNTQLAQDFLDLHFALENGAELAQFSRFEGPIAVRILGPAPTVLREDLAKLLQRLRSEAEISISQVPSEKAAQVTIQLVNTKDLHRRAPNAACIVIPNVSSWQEMRQTPRKNRDWRRLSERKRLSIFLPAGKSPQEARDCLHEELAQALGPPNDLFRLGNSVFNDDNFHSVLTAFDMMILKAAYAPELNSGMSKAAVAQALPAILRRVNPKGGTVTRLSLAKVDTSASADWRDAALVALSQDKNGRAQIAARRTLAIARQKGWTDVRLGLSWYLVGSHLLGSDRVAARAAFLKAERLFSSKPETQIHSARVALQLAALSLSEGDFEATDRITTKAIPAARNAQNAALLATLMMTKAEALRAMGRSDAAEKLRLDSLGWARYGFGSALVQTRLDEIARLTR